MTATDLEILQSIVLDFDLPNQRKYLDDFNNLMWLSRNMGIRNSQHADFEKAQQLLNNIIKDYQL